MEDTNRVYRIRTAVGEDAPNVIDVPLNQSYDMFEILSLKLNQTNAYKTYESDYGVIVGRVTANGGFGIPNAKVSIFIRKQISATVFLRNFLHTASSGIFMNRRRRFILLLTYCTNSEGFLSCCRNHLFNSDRTTVIIH